MQFKVNEVLFAYSEEIRLRILLLLKDSEVCVNCLVAVLELPQSTISRHIGILRRANVVKADRKGQNTYYTANLDNSSTGQLNLGLLNVYAKELKNQVQYQKDLVKLKKQEDICTVECKIGVKQVQILPKHTQEV